MTELTHTLDRARLLCGHAAGLLKEFAPQRGLDLAALTFTYELVKALEHVAQGGNFEEEKPVASPNPEAQKFRVIERKSK